MNPRFTLPMCVTALFLASCGTPGVHPNHVPQTAAVSSPKLDQLIKNYQPGRPGYGTSDAVDSAKRYHGNLDYAALIRAAAQGDVKALEKLMGLEMDGNAGEEHDSNMCDLLEGLGDKRFAAALVRCSPEVRRKVRSALRDFGGGEGHGRYEERFPVTFGQRS